MTKHHVFKTCADVDVFLHALLMSALHKNLLSDSLRFTLEELEGALAGLDTLVQEKNPN